MNRNARTLSLQGIGRIDPFILDIIDEVRPYTMTSPERIVALCRSIEHVEELGLQGSIVECGVWKGGSMMTAALSLLRLRGKQYRDLYLFDTFQGMTEPSSADIDLHGVPARTILDRDDDYSRQTRAVACLEEVRMHMATTEYPPEHLHFITGDVRKRLPQTVTGDIALLRLDLDWRDPTYHALLHLFPRLVRGGVLILDDYGHWQGAKEAVDLYFSEQRIDSSGLVPIDYTGCLMVKK